MASRFTLHPQRIDRERLASALAVAAVHAALGYALLTGLGVSLPGKVQEVLAAFDVTDPPPPRPDPPPNPPRPLPERAPRDEGAAAPPNLTSRATPIVAPDTPIPIPPPLTVTELPGVGAEATSGNAERVGPGTGAGGFGDGTGSGRYGNGPGGGGGGERAVPLRSDLGNLDCRDGAFSCPSVEITLRFTVGADGRVTDCRVLRASGDADVDRQTCPRAEQRMRFRPARDPSGRKVPAQITWVHDFEARERQPDYDERD